MIHFKDVLYQCLSIGQVRVQAIRGLPLFCKDTPEHIAKIVDILGQLLVSGKLRFFGCMAYSVGILLLVII